MSTRGAGFGEGSGSRFARGLGGANGQNSLKLLNDNQ